MNPSLAASLVNHILVERTGRTLAEYIRERRAEGTPWDTLARDLSDQLPEATVSRETVRRWAAELGTPESVA